MRDVSFSALRCPKVHFQDRHGTSTGGLRVVGGVIRYVSEIQRAKNTGTRQSTPIEFRLSCTEKR